MDVFILSVCCYNGSVDVGETSGGGVILIRMIVRSYGSRNEKKNTLKKHATICRFINIDGHSFKLLKLVVQLLVRYTRAFHLLQDISYAGCKVQV